MRFVDRTPDVTPCQFRWREMRRAIELRRRCPDFFPANASPLRCRRRIRDRESGAVFANITAAAKHFGLAGGTIRGALIGRGSLAGRLAYVDRTS